MINITIFITYVGQFLQILQYKRLIGSLTESFVKQLVDGAETDVTGHVAGEQVGQGDSGGPVADDDNLLDVHIVIVARSRRSDSTRHL